MNHPTAELRDESPAGLLALGLRGDGTRESELLSVQSPPSTIRRDTEIHMGMPLSDAERDTLV